MSYPRSVLHLPLIGFTACAPHSEEASPTPLPAVSASQEITWGEMVEAPTPCVWAKSTDEILWGTLTAVRLIEDPAVCLWMDEQEPPSQQWALVSCEYVNPAIELDIVIDRSLRGAIEGSASVRLGQQQVEGLRPLPYKDENGGLAWLNFEAEPGDPLVPGTKLGMAVHYVEEFGVWSAMGELMFGTDNDLVIFQEVYRGYREPQPADLAGLALDDFFATLSNCAPNADSEAADQRRTWVRTVWGPLGGSPYRYMSPTCLGQGGTNCGQ
jgi:hypothetical protein